MPKGNLVQIRDARELHGKKLLPIQVLVPGQSKPLDLGSIRAFLWDNAAYMLGFKAKDEKPERTRQCWEEFRNRHLLDETEINHPEFSAVCRFLERWDPKDATKHSVLADATTGFGVFKVTDNQRIRPSGP